MFDGQPIVGRWYAPRREPLSPRHAQAARCLYGGRSVANDQSEKLFRLAEPPGDARIGPPHFGDRVRRGQLHRHAAGSRTGRRARHRTRVRGAIAGALSPLRQPTHPGMRSQRSRLPTTRPRAPGFMRLPQRTGAHRGRSPGARANPIRPGFRRRGNPDASRVPLAVWDHRPEPGTLPQVQPRERRPPGRRGRPACEEGPLHEYRRLFRMVGERSHPEARGAIAGTDRYLRPLHRPRHVPGGSGHPPPFGQSLFVVLEKP